MGYLAARFKEPSTYNGLGTIAASGAAALITRDPAAMMAAVFGLIGFLMPDRKA